MAVAGKEEISIDIDLENQRDTQSSSSPLVNTSVMAGNEEMSNYVDPENQRDPEVGSCSTFSTEVDEEIPQAESPWDQWGSELRQGASRANFSLCYIRDVPENLWAAAGDVKFKYEPLVVSIGPYHRHKVMELGQSHKQLYLVSLMGRVGKSDPDFIISTIDRVLHGARQCYAYHIDLSDMELSKMLILDGCFILELLFWYHIEKENLEGDMVFNQNWMVAYIRRDLVLLENQIPFSVLENLFALLIDTSIRSRTSDPGQAAFQEFTIPCTQKRTPTSFLNELITYFFSPVLPTPSGYMVDSATCGEHLLDYLRKQLLRQTGQPLQDHPTRSASPYNIWDRISWGHTTCATDLQEAGVRFKGKAQGGSLLDVTFANGEFEIPPFHFGELWTVLFPNMIALEQCRSDYGDEITSYAILMDNLINSHKDVKLLRDKGIILGSSKEDKEIADAVNNLSKAAIVNNFHYDELCHRVEAYRQGTIATWRADFMRKFIHTPWAGISVIAGASLLLLTVAQTAFTLMSWKSSL